MQHHDFVSNAMRLGYVVRHQHDASATGSQSHQFLFDGLNVEPS